MTGEELVIVLPPVDEGRVSYDLRELTEVLVTNGLAEGWRGGLLGGEFGYGVEYENDIFMLHPFCWCDRSDCPWCLACECPNEATRYLIGDREVEFDEFFDTGGYAPADHRSEAVDEHLCAVCRDPKVRAPNFLHKPTGSRVSWYKYIGRGMETEINGNWREIYGAVLASLAAAPLIPSLPVGDVPGEHEQ